MSKAKITVYQKPTCTTCRKAMAIFKEKGIDIDDINYFLEPIAKEKLDELIRKMGISPKDLLRKKEEIYKDLSIGDEDYSDEELVGFMIAHPQLMQRPIIEVGDRAFLARPVDVIYDEL